MENQNKRRFYIARDALGFMFKSDALAGWSRMNNGAVNKKGIENYLTEDGRSNAVELLFVNKDLRPSIIYEVKRQIDFAEVSQNGGEKTFNLFDFNFVQIDEADKYFHDRQTNEINEKADRFAGLPKIQFYKEKADQTTLTNYKNMVRERMSENNIKDILTGFDPSKGADVFFVD